MSKIYIVIYDGAADHKQHVLNDRTPFEVAQTPNLDYIAAQGSQSLISVIGENICPESDSGAMAILSYDPLTYYTGRGPLEGLGAGFLSNDNKNAIAFRVNFASYNQNFHKLDRRTARDLSDAELEELTLSINKDINLEDIYETKFKLISYGHHRGIIGFWGTNKPISGQVTNTDPAYKNIKGFGVPVINFNPKPLVCEPLIDTDAARLSSYIVNEFIRRTSILFRDHIINKKRIESGKLPANILLFRDGGDYPRAMPSFMSKFGWSLSMYGQIPAENGLAKLVGANFSYSRQGNTPDEVYFPQAAEEFLSVNTDVAFIHLKGPDEPGHDSNPIAKVDAIEKIDKFFLPIVLNNMKKDDYLIITCDHATPCDVGTHTSDKVPLAIMGPNVPVDTTKFFNEDQAALGGLTITNAIEILPFVKKLSNS